MSSAHQTIYSQIRTNLSKALAQKQNEVLPSYLTAIYGKISRITDANIKDSVYAALVITTDSYWDAGQRG